MMQPKILNLKHYQQDACDLARSLLGKIICYKQSDLWLMARIIETEAYYIDDKASHASLGFTEKRKGLFMPAGTIYMYYARGGDSLNISARGDGNAVLIKSAFPFEKAPHYQKMIARMQQQNPLPSQTLRPIERLCNGQTLLCKSLGIHVPEWDQQQFNRHKFYIGTLDYEPSDIIQTQRLGIPQGRDEHLPYRFIDTQYLKYCTRKPRQNCNSSIS